MMPILIPYLLAAALEPRAARASDPVVVTASLARGVCALESVPDGVCARSCVDDGATWTLGRVRRGMRPALLEGREAE